MLVMDPPPPPSKSVISVEWQARRIAELERVASCLLDHYLVTYEMGDGQQLDGKRDAIAAATEKLIPNWRERRDEWNP